MRTNVRIAAALALSLSAACASTKYGSREYSIELTTVPPDCRGWVVPNTIWVVEKEKILHEGRAALEDFDSVRTPEVVRLPPYVHVFVAMDSNQRIAWKKFTPSRDSTVVIEFDEVDDIADGDAD